MKAILSFLFFMFAGIGMYAQVSQTGYYITRDGKRYNGVTIENPDYADACERVMISTEMNGGKYYYPKDIAAYGTNYGYKYVSAVVTIDGDTASVFLKELIRDHEILLYKYEGKKGEAFFTIDAAGKYAQITDGGERYRQLLQARAADCPVLAELDELPMRMTESSLTSLYESYTECSVNNYPGITWGFAVNAGYTWFNFEDKNRFEIPNRPYAMPGFFVEIPIDRRISFRAELYYFFTQTKSDEWDATFNTNNFDYKRHSLVLPLLFKYRFSNVQRKVLPYLELGATLDFKLSGNMRSVEGFGSDVRLLSTSGAKVAVGPEFGVGLEHKLDNNHVLYYGIRAGYYFGAAATDKREHRNNVSINCAISF